MEGGMTQVQAKRQTHSPEVATPVAVFLHRAAGELQQAAASLDAIAEPVDEAIGLGSGLRHPPLLNALQELDRTHQTLVCLAEFLVRIACATPSNWIVDAGPAAEAIPLSKLANRLQSPGGEKVRELEAAQGDCDIF
jgi:hypothetical protein